MRTSGWELGAIALTMVACSSVGGSDPGFWEQSRDIGGTQYDFAAMAAQGGASPEGQPNVPGAGGSDNIGGQTILPSGGAPNPGDGAGGNNVDVSAGGGVFVSAGGSIGGEAGGSGPLGAGGAVVVGPGAKCTFAFTVTTVTARGRYAPRNVGAIWIQDSAGKFVKSLDVWGTIRLSNATAWTSVSGNNTVDAVTSATRPGHGPMTANWDCTNTSHTPVSNGSYQVCATFAEDDSFPFFGPQPHMACAPFQTGAGPVDSSPPDATNFTGMHITLQ